MAELKTKPTDQKVQTFLEAIADEKKRKACLTIVELMKQATQSEPTMWGSGIIGFGSYHYRYESGREGDSCLTGFSSRKGDISIYLLGDFPKRPELLARLGRHNTAKACLYIRRLSDVNPRVLEQLVAGSIAAVKHRYGYTGG